MTGVEFSGIPTFGGIFLGQGYTISGLSLRQNSSVVGLFRYTQMTAVIDSVKVEGHIQPAGSGKIVGGIVGSNKGTIKNCTFNGTVSGKEQVGGIAGVNEAASIIENCSVSGMIYGNHYIGGIAGTNQGVIRQCTNEAKVNTEVEHNSIALSLDMPNNLGKKESIDSATNIGGITGSNSGVLRECYNKENVGYKKMGYNVGGIAGSQNGYITECINYAKIEGSDGVGGIVGQMKPNMVLEFGADPVKTMKGQMNSMMSSVKGLGNSISEIELDLGDSSLDMNAELNNMKNALDALEKSESNKNLEKSDLLNQLKDLNRLEDLGKLGDLSQLEDLSQLGDLSKLGDLSQIGDLGNSDISALLNNLQKQEEESLEEKEENQKKEADLLNSVMNSFSDSFNNIYKEGEKIKEETQNRTNEALNNVTNQMNSMMNQMQGMINSVSSVASNVGVDVNDISRADTPEDTIGKVADCENYGEVAGENAIGGIAGMLNNEIILSEGDVEVEGEANTNVKGTIRLVIRNSKNYGKIAASKKYVGGIAGNMVYGAIIGSCNSGNLDALSADYVGGIVGSCDTVIMNCYSKSIMAGADYVGGIAGYGTEVYNSYAFTDIAACTEYGGEILGNAKELPIEGTQSIKNNFYYYVGKDYGGIDGINYLNATGRVSLDEFLALENLDEMFKTVQVCFKAKGQEDVILSTKTGENTEKENIPHLVVAEGQMYDWRFVTPVVSKTLSMNEEEEVFYLTEERLNNLLFHQTYEADYEAKNMVSQGSDKTEDDHSIILAIGAFEKGTSVKLKDMLQQEYVILGETALQNWQVILSNPGVKKIHYRIPEGMESENLKLLIKDNSGNWKEREHMTEGSYLVFEFSDSESGFALVEKESFKLDLKVLEGIDFKLIGAGVAAVIVLLFMIVYIKKNYTIVKKGKKE